MTATKDRAVLAVPGSLGQDSADNAAACVASCTQDTTSILPGAAGAGRPATRDRRAAGPAGPHLGRQVQDEVRNVGQAEGGDGLVG